MLVYVSFFFVVILNFSHATTESQDKDDVLPLSDGLLVEMPHVYALNDAEPAMAQKRSVLPFSGGMYGKRAAVMPFSGGMYGKRAVPFSGGLYGKRDVMPFSGGVYGKRAAALPFSGGMYGKRSGGLFSTENDGKRSALPFSGGMYGKRSDRFVRSMPMSGGLYGR